MRLDDYLNHLQTLTDEKITYEKAAQVLKLKGKQSVAMRIKRGQELEEWEITALNSRFNEGAKNMREAKSLDKYTIGVYADYYPDVFGSVEKGKFVPSKKCEKVQIPEFCFIYPPKEGRKYSLINMTGDSMTPSINNKDKIIVQHTAYDEFITDNNIYAFIYDNRLLIRRLFRDVNDIIAKCDNNDFSTQIITQDKMSGFFIIGQIVGLIRDLR